jgi:hypothetical protein
VSGGELSALRGVLIAQRRALLDRLATEATNSDQQISF